MIVTKQPAKVCLVGNPIILAIDTEMEQYDDEGIHSYSYFTFGSAQTAGKEFTLSYGSNSIDFLFVANPNTSGTELPAWNGSESLLTWIGRVKTAMQNNYILLRDFTIANSGTDKLTLLAKEVGPAYDLTVTDSTMSSTTFNNSVPGIDADTKDYYALHCQPFLAGQTDALGEDRVEPDADSICEFDVAEYLKAQLVSACQWPQDASNYIYERASMCKEYFLAYHAAYGIPYVHKGLTKITGIYALTGGTSKQYLAELNEDGSTWYEQLQYDKAFLTWAPTTRKVFPYMPLMLYWLNYTSATKLTLRASLTYKVTSTYYTDTYTIDSITATAFKVYEFVVSPALVFANQTLNLPAGASMQWYTVWLEDQNGVKITQDRVFVYDQENYPYKKTFVFKNSYGAFDTVFCKGYSEHLVDLQRVEKLCLLDDLFVPTDAQVASAVNYETQKFTASTGWVHYDEIMWLRDMLLAVDLYEVIDNKLYRVVITTQQALINKDDVNLYALEFEYKRSYIDEYYSEQVDASLVVDPTDGITQVEPEKPAFGDDFGDDFGGQAQYIETLKQT